MRKNSFVAKDHISKLNDLRIYYSDNDHLTFTEKEFRSKVKQCGIPSSPILFAEFRKAGIINRLHGNVYMFNDPSKPIHYNSLQNVYANYHEKVKQYEHNRKHKKSLKKIKENKQIEEAINFLKGYGFEIFAPIGTLYSKK